MAVLFLSPFSAYSRFTPLESVIICGTISGTNGMDPISPINFDCVKPALKDNTELSNNIERFMTWFNLLNTF
jgi:hypothetical protein